MRQIRQCCHKRAGAAGKGRIHPRLLSLLSLVLLSVLSSLYGCSGTLPDGSQAEGTASDSRILLSTDSWPQNAYTDGLPVPAAGSIQTGWIDPEKRYCYIALTGIDDSAAASYLDQLRSKGFQELEQVSEEIRGQDYVYLGCLLSDGERALSLGHHQDVLGIYIRPLS